MRQSIPDPAHQHSRKAHGRWLRAILYACACLLVSTSHAALLYNVTVDTHTLIGNPAAPFYLDFQLNDGEGVGDANNSVTADNFNFGSGGAAVGSATISGGASGSLSAGTHFTDSSPFNELTQRFTPGSTLSFRVTLPTANIGPSGTPDVFSFAILHSADSVQGLLPIPTFDPAYQLFSMSIFPASPSIGTFMVDVSNPETPPGIGPFRPTVTAIPEPSLSLFGFVLLGLCARWWRSCSRPSCARCSSTGKTCSFC